MDKKYFYKPFLFSHHLNYVLHYHPLEHSKNGEAVFNPRYGVLEDWPEPDPEDPLSMIDKVAVKLNGSCYELIC